MSGLLSLGTIIPMTFGAIGMLVALASAAGAALGYSRTKAPGWALLGAGFAAHALSSIPGIIMQVLIGTDHTSGEVSLFGIFGALQGLMHLGGGVAVVVGIWLLIPEAAPEEEKAAG